MTNQSNYYIGHKKRFLWEFDLVARSARSVVEEHFDKDAGVFIAETRQEFEAMIPQFPFIGGKQPHTEFIAFTGMLLAVYRVNTMHGKTVEQTGEMVFEMGRAFLDSLPTFLLRLFMPLNFSQRAMDRIRKAATESQQRKYAEGNVIVFVEGDGKNFDYGVDYLECASCKFLTKQGVPELAPYLCPVDIHYSRALGWGLTRTMTLAEGADRCDFRFKKGGPTNVAVPAALQHLVDF